MCSFVTLKPTPRDFRYLVVGVKNPAPSQRCQHGAPAHRRRPAPVRRAAIPLGHPVRAREPPRAWRAADASRGPHPSPSLRAASGAQMGFWEEAALATRYTGGGRRYSRSAGTKQGRAAQRGPMRWGRLDKGGWDRLRKSPKRELPGTGCARARGDHDDASPPRSGPARAKGYRFIIRR